MTAHNSEQINLADFAIANHVLGPGRRAIIWVQGCPRRCAGCITPHMQQCDRDREWVTPEDLAQRVLDHVPLEGITFVGGEPFCFAAQLGTLVTRIRQTADLSVVTYTGYTRAELQDASRHDWDGLLSVTDMLIDGEYIEQQACDLLWRGSANQHIHYLTPRYAPLEPAITTARGRLLEFGITARGHIRIIGIPEPGFFHRLDNELRSQGINLRYD